MRLQPRCLWSPKPKRHSQQFMSLLLGQFRTLRHGRRQTSLEATEDGIFGLMRSFSCTTELTVVHI
jgi:hypothetical protein